MLAQQLVNGLTLGAVDTLIALSFSLVMGSPSRYGTAKRISSRAPHPIVKIC